VKLSVAQQAGGQGRTVIVASAGAPRLQQQHSNCHGKLKKQSTNGDCGDSSRRVSNGTASQKKGEQESTDCHIGKTVRLQQQSTQGRSMHRQGLRQEQQVAPTARGLQTPWGSEQQR